MMQAMEKETPGCGGGEDPFAPVLEAEMRQIAGGREGGAVPPGSAQPPEVYARARGMQLAGLAFSGGGIRSAAFNLGVIQGLARGRVLHMFDYLSTVSGGGYIGGWLSALLHRSVSGTPGEAEVRRLQETLLATPPAGVAARISGFPAPESRPIRFIRQYANYLTPRLGLSGDTVALLSIALRNVVVMQMLLVSLLAAVFLGILVAAAVGAALPAVAPSRLPSRLPSLLWPVYGLLGADPMEPGRWLVAPALVLLLTALAVMLWSQRRQRGLREDRAPNAVVFVALAVSLVAGVMFALGAAKAAEHGSALSGGVWVMIPALGYALAWSGTLFQSEWRRALRAGVGMLGGAVTFALLLHLCLGPLSRVLGGAPFGHVVAFGPGAALAIYSLVITVHLALAGSAISEQNREWWARAGGQGILLGVLWALAYGFLLYVPPLLQVGAAWSVAGGGLWSVLTWLGARFARGGDTGAPGGSPGKEIMVALAPWLFVGGLVGLVAWGLAWLLPGVVLHGGSPAVAIANYQASLAHVGLPDLALGAVAAASLFLFLVAFVDLNLFSAHSFYRNRLGRTFLGASRPQRRPNPFTGFDPEDDLPLADLAGQRPLHLINANLNLTGGQELAWQTRRGASFVLSPDHCGYAFQTSTGVSVGGYRPTDRYAGSLSLATAVAVSGAAASPNMGFHSSTAVAAMLTAFNLRLARWCPNPPGGQWERREPRWWSAGPLFAELFGEARGDGAWVNLSDGGHFENLGLYELVRRRAAFILVTDAGADPHYQFDDLAMAVRKLWVDFGVRLEIAEADLEAIRPQPSAEPDAPAFSSRHWAIGRIRYPDAEAGVLIYVKNSLTADAPVDIRQYRDAHPAFPHESTLDQWFNEDQFEAYRHLGQEIAEAVCGNWLSDAADAPAQARIAAVCARLEEALGSPDQR